MPYLSNITIMGHAGNSAECREVGDTTCTTVNVAVNTRYKEKGGDWKDRTTWWRVSVWGKQAEAANQYLSKGRQVLVEGRLRPDPNTGGPRLWTRQDGTVGASYEMVAERVQFLGGGNGSNGNGNGQGASEPVYDQ